MACVGDGEQAAAIERAIECYVAAQSVFRQEFYAAKWAALEAAKGE